MKRFSRISANKMDYNKRKRYHRRNSYSRRDYEYREKRQRKSDEELVIKSPYDFLRIKHDIHAFLEEHLLIKQVFEFWQFFEKYEQAIRLRGNSGVEPAKLIYFNYEQHIGDLHSKLPSFTRNSEKLTVEFEAFKKFVLAAKTYQDFQQKSKFTKLKKLREFQKELPISNYKDELIEALQTKQVILIAGDTGCGKSTQVPQYLLEAGYKKVVCTQPRRIACVSLSKRVAYESLNSYTDVVGYQIRFEKTKRAETKVIFMTEGLLLRHTTDEETLNAYDAIILDEVHERHLNGDFLVGIMKCLLYQKKSFKLILMSATINLELFTNYFANDNLHVIQVPGRLFPIEIKYFPIIKDPYEKKNSRFDSGPYIRILELIDQKYPQNEKGDLLVFLNGYSEISYLAEAVKEYSEEKKNWIVLMLHSSLSLEEQDKVFDISPDGCRKCIISTNIAETSVTIDGIRFVIDSGKVNRMTYVTGGVNKLSEVTISQDSAKQRSGRAGRTGPGVCFRLYSEKDFESFDAFTPAEIHLVPLESLLLSMVTLGLKDISNFPFLERPDSNSIDKSLEKLKFIGALANKNNELHLTPLGDALSRLPVDLTIGKMLIMSTIFGNVESVLILAALLSVQSPITQQSSRNTEVMDLLKPLDSNHGDPMSLLNYFKEWLEIKQTTTVQSRSHRHHTQENSKRWCRKRGLEEQRFYEVTKLYAQFRNILQDAKLIKSPIEIEASSSERSIRKGELRQLKTMSRELKNEKKTTKRKYLKHSSYETEEGSEGADLKDVEFRILNDSKKIAEIIEHASAASYRTLTLLKLILTSGLYPQFAIEDEFNSAKTVSERLFHTKYKSYVFLRPFSYFALNYEILELHDDDIEVPPPGYFSKRPLSQKHQLLVYQSILETKKVYLVNTMRMSALQTLLLFSDLIATNATLTKMIFDDFMVVNIPFFGQGKLVLQKAMWLRKRWRDKLDSKLTALDSTLPEHGNSPDLVENLLEFMQFQITYNIKRLLPADLKIVYNSNSEFFQVEKPVNPTENPFDSTFEICENHKLGGLQMSDNLVYNCLVQEEWEYDILGSVMSEPYLCSVCEKMVHALTFFEILQHEAGCQNSKNEATGSLYKPQEVKTNSKEFSCEVCGKTLVLTPVEILRHKRSCKALTT